MGPKRIETESRKERQSRKALMRKIKKINNYRVFEI